MLLPIINDAGRKLSPGEYINLLGSDSVLKEEANPSRYTKKFLNSLFWGSLPQYVITFKKGFIFMILGNINTLEWLSDGKSYIVENIKPRLLYHNCSAGDDKGKRFLLPKILCPPGSENFPVPGVSMLKFAVRKCFSVTTNKAHGQSFGSKIWIYLTDQCSAHGQLFDGILRAADQKTRQLYI